MQQPATALHRDEMTWNRFSTMPIGQLRRLRRELATGLGLAPPRSGSRAALENELRALETQLDGRRWHEQIYPARADRVREARAAVAKFLDGYDRADDAVLIVDELATNAILHSASRYTGVFTARAEIHRHDVLWVEVEDAGGPWEPAADDGESGRGLRIVASLCSGGGSWGIANIPSGRVVWAMLVPRGVPG